MEQRSRRSFLGLLGATGVVGTAGCLGSEGLSVLSAGSLAVVLESVGMAFAAERSVQFQGEYHGSTAAMQLIEDQSRHPDVAISADARLLRDRLYPEYASWDVVFAANEIGLAYDPDTDLGRRLDAGEPWYDVLRSAETGAIAISDPELDPLGYRAIQLLELAEQRYGMDGLREDVLDTAAREIDEPRLLTGVETGDRAIAVAYRNMAVDHGLAFYELPDSLNFSNPERSSQYEAASYTTADGDTVRGSPITYNVTVLETADNPDLGRGFVSFLLGQPEQLETNGLTVPAQFPQQHGNPPALGSDPNTGVS